MDTFFAGTLKGVGKVYIQTVLDCFSRFVWARLYTSKMPVTAVQILNNHALPFFEKHRVKVQTILSDNGREYCGRPDKHPYELFLTARGDRTPHHEGRQSPSRTASSSGSTARSSRSTSGSRAGRPGTRRSRRCRRSWTAILRPTTPVGPTVAAGWRAGRPTRSSRPGSHGSRAPGNPQPPGRRSRKQRRADLGEAGCQVITILVQPDYDPTALAVPGVPHDRCRFSSVDHSFAGFRSPLETLIPNTEDLSPK